MWWPIEFQCQDFRFVAKSQSYWVLLGLVQGVWRQWVWWPGLKIINSYLFFIQTEESLVTAYGVCHIVGKYLLNLLTYMLYHFLVKVHEWTQEHIHLTRHPLKRFQNLLSNILFIQTFSKLQIMNTFYTVHTHLNPFSVVRGHV